MEEQPAPPVAVDMAANEAGSVRSCSMSAHQVYERFEKLPMEQRKALAEWVKRACAEVNPSIVLPKGADGAEGRPELWRVAHVDTQRWDQFVWKPIRWIAVLSPYTTPEALMKAAMAILDTLAVPLCILINRYPSASQAICVEVPVRYGLAMTFIRAQAKSTEKQLVGVEEGAPEEERAARDAWLAEGLSANDYRSFALQLFSLRQENDPPFVLMVFRGTPEKMAVVWFRDVHLAQSVFCKGLFPSSVEHLYWPNYTHLSSSDPPRDVCERPECGRCGGLTSDAKLLSTFVRHIGPWRAASKELVRAEMKRRWEKNYQPRIDAAKAETAGRASDADMALMESQLREQAEGETEAVVKAVEDGRTVAFKRCGRCKLARYCSNECQKLDWTRHGKYCLERGK